MCPYPSSLPCYSTVRDFADVFVLRCGVYKDMTYILCTKNKRTAGASVDSDEEVVEVVVVVVVEVVDCKSSKYNACDISRQMR
jgi:hypothetical protein